jgi:5-methylcytosine-specific restriction endonuclease McrA
MARVERGRSGRPYRRVRAELKAQRLPCHICGKAIDYSLQANDPMSFAMDHVNPMARGGHPLARSNVRAAHRRCNSAKGVKDVADVVIIPSSRDW